jgi:hypothetical protein
MKIKHYIFLLLSSLFIAACQENEEKIIQTDLSKEANQLFNISNYWGESLYFALLKWEDYKQIVPCELPGSPKISLEQTLKQVTLEFLPDTLCVKTGRANRTGKIRLDYPSELSANREWTIEYQGYTVNQNSISGIRRFLNTKSNEVAEEFENLDLTTQDGVESSFSGNFIHTTNRINLELVRVSSIGMLSGINPVGRKFTTEFVSPRQILASCIKENEILPFAGKESWTVERGSDKKVIHQINYESTGNCTVNATVTLSDGRYLVLTP